MIEAIIVQPKKFHYSSFDSLFQKQVSNETTSPFCMANLRQAGERLKAVMG